MEIKSDYYAGIYDPVTDEYVCRICYGNRGIERPAVRLPIGGMVKHEAVCTRCGRPLEVSTSGHDPKVIMDAVIRSSGGLDQPRDWDDIVRRLHELKGYEGIEEDRAKALLGWVFPEDQEMVNNRNAVGAPIAELREDPLR